MSTVVSSKRYEDMTIPNLKNELKQRKLKTSGAKSELVKRLKRYDEDDGSHVENSNNSDDDNDVEKSNHGDERDDDLDETVIHINERGDDEEEVDRPIRRRGCMLTFRDVEDAIDRFSGDDGKNINQWIKEFDDLAKLCEWSTVH